MRFVTALLLSVLVCAPLACTVDDTSTAPTTSKLRSSGPDLPLSLTDLKLEQVGWSMPVGEYSDASDITWCEIDGKELFCVDSEHVLHCVNTETGIHKWILTLPGAPTHAPGVGRDSVGVVIKDRVILVNRATGARLMDKTLREFPSTSPAVTLNSVFAGVFIEKKLQSIDAKSGLPGWSFKFRDFLTSAPQITGEGAEQFIYAAGNDGAVICISLKEATDTPPSKVSWKYKTNGANTAGISFGGDKVLVPSEDSILYALNRFTGTVDWKVYTGAPLREAVQVVNGMVFLQTDMGLKCFDLATGKEKWCYETGVCVAGWKGTILYITTQDEELSLINMDTGEAEAELIGDGVIEVVPNAGEGMLVLKCGTSFVALK